MRYRRPRHTLKGRQDAEAVDRGGLRLKLFKAQAEAGDIALLFADESEALTDPYLARAWAKRGADLRVLAPGQAQKIAMISSLDYARRKLIVTTSRTKRSADFIAHLQELDRLRPQARPISTASEKLFANKTGGERRCQGVCGLTGCHLQLAGGKMRGLALFLTGSILPGPCRRLNRTPPSCPLPAEKWRRVVTLALAFKMQLFGSIPFSCSRRGPSSANSESLRRLRPATSRA